MRNKICEKNARRSYKDYVKIDGLTIGRRKIGNSKIVK
jgi:hypothetical protein